jgi:hypothetical protein
MKAEESIVVTKGDTVWVSEYDGKPRKSGIICASISTNVEYKNKKSNAAFCVTYKAKTGKIKTKWVNRARVVTGARIVLTEKIIPIKELNDNLIISASNSLGMSRGMAEWSEIQNIIDGD